MLRTILPECDDNAVVVFGIPWKDVRELQHYGAYYERTA